MKTKETMGSRLLNAYLSREDVRRSDLIERVGCTKQAMSQWTKAQRVPTIHFGLALQRATDGAVPIEAWDL